MSTDKFATDRFGIDVKNDSDAFFFPAIRNDSP